VKTPLFSFNRLSETLLVLTYMRRWRY